MMQAIESKPQMESPAPLAERVAGSRSLGISALVFAALQAVCPAFVAFSAVRVAVGISSVLAAQIGTALNAWHVDWLRIPMMTLAAAGALLNLFVIWHVRRLRNRPAAQWRVTAVPASKIRSERLQIALAALTFVCLGAEWVIHFLEHSPHRL